MLILYVGRRVVSETCRRRKPHRLGRERALKCCDDDDDCYHLACGRFLDSFFVQGVDIG